MDAYQRVLASLAHLSPDAVRRFACACAARLLGGVHVVLVEESAVACREALASAQAGMMSPAAAGALVKRLEALPEADVDDSLEVRYFGMLAIGLVFHAVRAAGSDASSGAMIAGSSLDLAAELCRGSEDAQLVRLAEEAELADVASLASSGEVSHALDQAIVEECRRCMATQLRLNARSESLG